MSRFLIPNNFVQRNDLKLESKSYPLPLLDSRVWDAPMSLLPTTSANDDLGVSVGTWATSAPTVQTSDLKAAGSTTRYSRHQFVLPPEYVAGESVVLRINAGMVTTVADTACTVDAVVYENTGAAISSDLCATAAQSMNSLTAADKDFTITATSLGPGDLLDIRLAVLVNDAATGTAVIAKLNSVSLVLSVRG